MGARRASLLAVLAFGTALSRPGLADPPGSDRSSDPIARIAALEQKRYEWLHAHPELSGQESKTAAFLAREVRKLGFVVRERIGGHGLVATLKNGQGKTLMVRTELDALPVVEETGLPYASRVKARPPGGEESAVMHACGHDLHMAAWLGAAEFFASQRDLWQGTLILIAQPAEETLQGARAMLNAGLLGDSARPDLVFALHAHDQLPVGTVGFTEGPFAASADSVSIVLYGKGGHGAYPENAIDPIVMAAKLIVSLQTIVSREVNPLTPAVLTIGSVHAGTKDNVIPGEARLELTVRAYSDETRKQILSAIERLTNAEAKGMNAPRPPLITVRPGAGVAVNDPEMTRALIARLRKKEIFELVSLPREMGSEDFAEFGRAGLRSVMLMVGTAPKDLVPKARRAGAKPSSLHSGTYAPAMPGSLEAAIRIHAEVGLSVLARQGASD